MNFTKRIELVRELSLTSPAARNHRLVRSKNITSDFWQDQEQARKFSASEKVAEGIIALRWQARANA